MHANLRTTRTETKAADSKKACGKSLVRSLFPDYLSVTKKSTGEGNPEAVTWLQPASRLNLGPLEESVLQAADSAQLDPRGT
jgi:hypothetical protein